MNGCIVLNKHDFYKDYQFQEYGEVDIRNILISAGRINLDTLIIDLDTAPATSILPALHTYRVQRPNTRIIILAQGRQPGDKAVAGVIAMGIYDIVAPDDEEDIIPALERVINNQPATYTQAARWAVQIEEEEEPEPPKKKKFWEKVKHKKPSKLDEDNEDEIETEPKHDPDLLATIIKEIESLNKAMEELKSKAQTDPLTGLYNREFMDNWLKIQFAQGENFAIAFLDLDKFKSVNDTYGHAAGDAVLTQFSAFLKTQVRKSDVVIRYGGEEIVIGLPGTNLQAATNLIERIRQTWEQTDISISPSQNIRVTFSAGVADYKTAKKDVVKVADEMVYQAKESGRNRVCSGVKAKAKAIQQTTTYQTTGNTAVATPGTITAVADGTATIGDTAGAILSIVYHLLRTGFYLLLLAGLIIFVLFVSGKVAGIFPTQNNLTQFLISASTIIGNYLKYLF